MDERNKKLTLLSHLGVKQESLGNPQDYLQNLRKFYQTRGNCTWHKKVLFLRRKNSLLQKIYVEYLLCDMALGIRDTKNEAF